MTTPNIGATAPIQNSTNNTSNQETLSKIKTALTDSVSLIELMQSVSLIAPQGEPLHFDHMKLQGFSTITNDLLSKLKNVRVLIDENPGICGSISELDELIFEAMGLISFTEIFQVSKKDLASLHSSQLSGLYFVMQRVLDCIKESQSIIDAALQTEEPVSKDRNVALPEIFWRLRVLEKTTILLQDLVRCEGDENILLANECVHVFDDVLHELGESILSITCDLEDNNSSALDIPKMREQLKDANNQVVTLLTFLLPNSHSEYVTIYDEFLSTFDLLLGNVQRILRSTSEELSTAFVGGAA